MHRIWSNFMFFPLKELMFIAHVRVW